jgi:hypothetical protein
MIMVTIVKHEWHSHDRQYAVEIDEALLSEIYPDLNKDEILRKLAEINSGDIDCEEVLNHAFDNDVEINWEFQYDDCWTDRKGGYDVTYALGDEFSWHSKPEPDPPTHKCSNCKWEGSEYEVDWKWEDENGNALDDAKDVCKYCESDVVLTDFGIQKKKDSDDEQAVPCFSCGAMYKESELPELDGQYHCPSCNEGWVMMEFRDEDHIAISDLEKGLEELKQEFERLITDSNPEKKKRNK